MTIDVITKLNKQGRGPASFKEYRSRFGSVNWSAQSTGFINKQINLSLQFAIVSGYQDKEIVRKLEDFRNAVQSFPVSIPFSRLLR